METICKYCSNSFVPKRTDSLYCSHSCRQLAYVLRKATGNTFEGVKYKPETLIILQNKQESSIETEIIDDDPSTNGNESGENVNELTDKGQEPSINQGLIKDYPSTKHEIPVKKETELSVNALTKANKDQEEYKEYSSPLVDEIAKLTEERNNLHTLFGLLHNNTGTSSYWISLRYRCLIECLLTFSEMQFIDIDDLKEVCNAFTAMIQSRSFSYLTPNYPYTKDIIRLRDTIKNLCLNAENDEQLALKFKKDTKLKLIATRWELANYVPKISFAQLDFQSGNEV